MTTVAVTPMYPNDVERFARWGLRHSLVAPRTRQGVLTGPHVCEEQLSSAFAIAMIHGVSFAVSKTLQGRLYAEEARPL